MLSYADIARAVGGRFFRVVFVKRTDGSVRVMRARLGVRKHLSGGGSKYSFASKNLLSVWDLDAKGYRAVPLDAIMEFRCGRVVLADNGYLIQLPAQDTLTDGRTPALYPPGPVAPPAHKEAP